jgi:hypothetical protein
MAANAINRDFRYDENRTRPGIHNIRLTFANEDDRIWFSGGNLQGAYFYNSYPSFLKSSIMCSIAGKIFRIEIKGEEGNVTTIFQGDDINDPVLQHAWFAQGFEWLVIQDGLNKPIIWDGTNKARRAGVDEVPTGSVMATIHGRLVVSSADGTNQIAVGDIVYGEDQTSTADIIRFTEIQYWAEGGAFGAPVYVGDITGLYAMPYLDTGTGQNELVVLGTEGAVSLDLSRPRTQWLDTQLLRISLIGGGCVSSHSLTALNGDLFFRSAEGIRSYRNARAEFQQSWKQTPISSDVRYWQDYDRPDLLQFNSQVSWNNYLLSTCSPQLEGANSLYAGFHRYHRGFVVMDAEPASSTARQGLPLWYGMHTGIRPTQFVEGRIESSHRCFAFSFDRDGTNRLYEITRSSRNDTFETQPRKIWSGYDSPSFGTIERTTSDFELKTLEGGELAVSDLRESTAIELFVRPDNSPCFFEHYSKSVGCDCLPSECFTTTRPGQARMTFNISETCDPSTQKDIRKLHRWQARVRALGYLKVDTLAYRFIAEKNPTTCGVVGGTCTPITCCSDADAYTYHIAPEGDNVEIPNIPVPSDVVPVYNSIQYFTATCPPPSIGGEVTSSAAYSSTISQADADVQAKLLAQNAAISQLRCYTCQNSVLVDAVVESGASLDLSSVFAPYYAPSVAGQPWRLIDVVTMGIYASGVVDPLGTLLVFFFQSTGDVTFDPVTYIFHNTVGDTDVPITLQTACPGSNGQVWPDIPSY